MNKDHSNRIPGTELSTCQSWAIPNLEGAEKVLPSAEKEDRERREEERRRLGEVVGEEIELDDNQQWMTVEQLTRISENAHKEGFEAGFKEGEVKGQKEGAEKGQAQALAETRQSLAEQQQRLDQLLNGLLTPFEEHTQALEVLFERSVTCLAEAVLQRELQLDPSHIQAAVKQAVAALPKGEELIHVFLHPDDIGEVKKNQSQGNREWSIHADDQLAPGGCRVTTAHSTVDFSIPSRLQAALKLLAEAAPPPGENSEPSIPDGNEL